VNSFWIGQQVFILVFLGALLLIALSNLFTLQRLGTYPSSTHFPRVSILVPARNEEVNIESCVRSLVCQDYPDFEVLVLDDNSQDHTGQILARLTAEFPRLHVIHGRPLPSGWIGKHWACHQLAQGAGGELLLFTDADTRHRPQGLRHSVEALLSQKADLLSVLPHEEVVSWPEQLVVPMIAWSIFAFLPLALAYRLRMPMLSSTIGQFMLFRRSAYQEVGGYAAVRQEVVDDIALGQRVKAAGLRWRLADGQSTVTCRMYRNFGEVWEGFSKNMFASLGSNIPLFLLAWGWQVVAFLEPVTILLLMLLGVHCSALSAALAAGAVAISLLLWGTYYGRFNIPFHLTFLYPASVLFSATIATRSMILSLRGQASWKGRKLERQRVKLW
jgi:chlorobactene glucosyltransferase